MSNAWSVERWRITLTLLAIPLLGFTLSNWTLAVVLPLLGYIAWNLFQFYKLEKWLRTGAFKGKAPDANGVWALIVQQIYRQQRKEKRRKKRLSELLKRFNATVAALPDATVILNGNDEIEWANKAAEQFLGIQRNRDIGVRIANLIRDPDFDAGLKKFVKELNLELGSPINPDMMLALRMVRYGKDKKLLTARDISQRVELQRTRKAFVANASHELKTPLTVISGYLEIMQSDPKLPPELADAVDSATEQAQRMQRIIEDLLVLSRLEGTLLSHNSGERLSIAGILGQIITDLQQTLSGQSHRFVLDTDEALFLRGNEAEIQSICMNLISNAVKYTPAGTTIDVRWYRDSAGHACLDVEDNGPGIPAEHLPHLTERFYRVDAGRSREIGGTGLGLSIVKHVVQRHGGFLQIDSEPGKGSTFRACFPAYRLLS
ncbi:MAG: phosphate regulon sensor histidine kinase PhoR [Gammaproteobacteria bacterium]|jgi:two-component system, OmpR family, phosphate regulon sensor histidine kinase PhoR